VKPTTSALTCQSLAMDVSHRRSVRDPTSAEKGWPNYLVVISPGPVM
jgi:hypothetical protein